MKPTKGDNKISKALRDRYSRILEIDFSAAEAERADKNPIRRHHFQWPLLLLMPLAVAFGIWFLIQTPSNSTDNPPPPTALQQPPSPPLTANKPEANPPEPVIAKSAVDNHITGESATQIEPPGTDGPETQQPLYEINQPDTAETRRESAASGTFLVVLLSTLLKDEAIERAKELNGNNYRSEVILSSTGYYGVVLRQNSYEEAKNSMTAAVASGVAKTRPYIMSNERVKAHVYPEAE